MQSKKPSKNKNINLVKTLSFFERSIKLFSFPKQGQAAVSGIVSAMLLGKYFLLSYDLERFFSGFHEMRGVTADGRKFQTWPGCGLPPHLLQVSFPETWNVHIHHRDLLFILFSLRSLCLG